MKPICVPCQRFYRPAKTGYYFIEAMPRPTVDGHRAQSGTAEPDAWEPYKVWGGDLWRCEGCGAEIVSGVGHYPVAERHEPDFQAVVDRLTADQLIVNDC